MRQSIIGLMLLALLLAASCAQAGETEAGTPREDTLIIDGHYVSIPKPNQLNPFQEDLGGSLTQGLEELAIGALWEIDTTTGRQFPDLAATDLEVLDSDSTKFRFKTRQGLKWSDGVDFSAEDVVFTAKMLMDRPNMAVGSYLKLLIKDIRKVDDSTVEIDTLQPSPHLEEQLGVVIAGTHFLIMPEHIWQNKDPAHYANSDPVATGPYTLKRADPHGDWVLWERRADWEHSDVGQIRGRPEPRYVLYRSYGEEEERVAAMARNDLDIALPLSQTSFEKLRSLNPYVHGWSDKFPWANMDDPCDKGIHFNDQVYPFDNPSVRWALALAIDIDTASMDTMSGALRAATLAAPPTAVLTRTYYEPMRQWLADFKLPDGYQPFDPGFATRMAEKLRSSGEKEVPTDPAEARALFGIGWWRHDPDEASRLLQSAGFKKVDGKWLMPDRTRTQWFPWVIKMNIPDGFEVLQEQLGLSVVRQWQAFGIDVQPQRLDYARFVSAFSDGTFEAGPYWSGSCAVGPDLFTELAQWHSKYIRPYGMTSSFNRDRFGDSGVDAVIDNIVALQPNDPRQVEYGTELLQKLVAQLPAIQMFGTTQYVPVNTYYWMDEPSAANPYEGPWWWWSTFKFMLPKFRQTGRH